MCKGFILNKCVYIPSDDRVHTVVSHRISDLLFYLFLTENYSNVIDA